MLRQQSHRRRPPFKSRRLLCNRLREFSQFLTRKLELSLILADRRLERFHSCGRRCKFRLQFHGPASRFAKRSLCALVGNIDF